jgi:Flp pilus assembly protein TadG
MGIPGYQRWRLLAAIMGCVRTTTTVRKTRRLTAGVADRARGQSVAEFAILLPIILTLVLGGIDFSRAFERQMRLEQAIRQASETVAARAQSSSEAQDIAREVVCVQLGRAADCTLGTIPDPLACSDLCLEVTFSRSTTALGATVDHPLATARVTAAAAFRTAVPYPLLTSDTGDVTLSAAATYSILQGR